LNEFAPPRELNRSTASLTKALIEMTRATLSILGLILTAQCGKHVRQSQPAANQTSQSVTQTCDFSSYKPLKAGMYQAPAIALPQPEYPSAAKAKKLQGTVTVKILVNLHSGIVQRACVVSGDETLGKAATEAALKARFSPDWGNNKYLAKRYDYVEGDMKYNFVAN